MKRRSWILPLVLAVLAAAPGFSQDAPEQDDKAWRPVGEEAATDDPAEKEKGLRWRPLVEHTLKKTRGQQKYLVGWEKGRGVRTLRFEIEGTPVEILRIEVLYSKGKSAEWALEAIVPDQQASPVLELDPDQGYVVKLWLDYRLNPPEASARYEGKLKATVILAGRH